MKFDKLETRRLELKPLEPYDCDELTENLNNRKIYDGTFHIPFPYTKKDAEKYINSSMNKFETKGTRDYGIRLKTDNSLIGCISIGYNSINNSGEVAYWISEKHWNNGYASEALSKVLENAFTEDDYNKVYGLHYKYNLSSEKVMMKNKMKKDGVLRDHIYKDEKYLDVNIYSILKKEYIK